MAYTKSKIIKTGFLEIWNQAIELGIRGHGTGLLVTTVTVFREGTIRTVSHALIALKSAAPLMGSPAFAYLSAVHVRNVLRDGRIFLTAADVENGITQQPLTVVTIIFSSTATRCAERTLGEKERGRRREVS